MTLPKFDLISIFRAATCALLVFGSHAAADDPTWDWTERERRVLRSLSLSQLGPPPASPGNRVADDPRAAEFGQQLFFDTRFSANGDLSCASCHMPSRDFTDGVPRAIGLGKGNRNTPTITGTAWNEWFYWDGRRDSLWSQALIPFEAENEMGGDRLSVVRAVAADDALRSDYESLFGPMPAFDDIAVDGAGPLASAPQRDAWYRLSNPQQQRVNTTFANLGKAIAAWERTQHFRPSAFDAYVDGLEADSDPTSDQLITDEAKAGARLFMDADRTQCLQCHNGPNLTNGGFHNIGTGNFDG
ncbi:MAG: cytochrome-c peroxidase, partial [Pseudomonadota bacterium]